ncbi:O-methyltransferase [Psychroflexus sediminis]|uniref:Predicted O-methyltransferase YrrM n=1 Tax=Psychroflexus sediminis TaxID=470826 RepID=A0A1G7Y7A8_9FLAO|nr:O-methyltransferase [Psychroflexus sediminis]SDG92338.1 Predicted O-methyltransferase YrrM [Psychroflexus sediminis]
MDFISKELQTYVEAHTEDEPELLQRLTKETWQKVLQPRMLSGHYQGRILSLISKLIKPASVLEIGTYTGYSALCLAEGLSKGGKIHTIDRNEELYDLQRKYFDLSGHGQQIFQYTGDARQIIPEIHAEFDLVFIDADKTSYPLYFELIIDKLKAGGLLLSDNVLWSGKVVEELNPKDKDTKALLEYNLKLKEDPRIETVLLPVRDGFTISRKR